MTRHRSTSGRPIGMKSRYRPRVEALEPRLAPAFLPGVQYATGATPTKPDVADFNLDGKLDIAVGTCFISQVSVLLGNGDGTLAPFQEFPNQGTCPYSTETADMNNDGIPDLELANSFGGSISVHLGVGDGTFETPIITSLPNQVFDVVVRDFNSDGIQDAAAIAYHVHKVYIMLGNGDGTLQHVGTLNPALDPIQIDAGDFNNDGVLDLATANQGNGGIFGSFSRFLGNGDGTFKPKLDYSTGANKSNAIAIADFDNDGNADVVVSNSLSNRLTVFKGNGNGTFQPPVPYRVRSYPVGLAVSDFNLDGYKDIAVSCAADAGSVTLLLNDRAGRFYRHSINPMPSTYDVVSADLNSDGYFDVVASNIANNKVTVLINDADWVQPAPVPPPPTFRDNKRTPANHQVVSIQGNEIADNRVSIASGGMASSSPQKELVPWQFWRWHSTEPTSQQLESRKSYQANDFFDTDRIDVPLVASPRPLLRPAATDELVLDIKPMF